MPKYLLQASYSAQGVRGVMKEGGTKREAAARALVESLGGRIEAFYFAHGSADVVVICEFPTEAAGLAAVMAVNASGLVTGTTTPLITSAEMDAAAKMSGTYRAPGE
ncbi:MAG: GYD domain-containing protein [Acidobacteria bacterium]|nr:GYD domain-containing protein [Acidobacteriota bacterium]